MSILLYALLYHKLLSQKIKEISEDEIWKLWQLGIIIMIRKSVYKALEGR